MNNEKSISYLCDTNNWKTYKTEEASYAIGTPSLEMYIKAYNIYYGNDNLVCKMDDITRKVGYLVGVNNSYSVNSGYKTQPGDVNVGPISLFVPPREYNGYMWLASPSSYDSVYVLEVDWSSTISSGAGSNGIYSICPVVCIPH